MLMRFQFRDPQRRLITIKAPNFNDALQIYNAAYNSQLPYAEGEVGYPGQQMPGPAPVAPATPAPTQRPSPQQVNAWRAEMGLPPRDFGGAAPTPSVPTRQEVNQGDWTYEALTSPPAPSGPSRSEVNAVRQQYGREPLPPFSAPAASTPGPGLPLEEVNSRRARWGLGPRETPAPEQPTLAQANAIRRSYGLEPIDRLFPGAGADTPSPAASPPGPAGSPATDGGGGFLQRMGSAVGEHFQGFVPSSPGEFIDQNLDAVNTLFSPVDQFSESIIRGLTFQPQGTFQERAESFQERPWWQQLGVGLVTDPTVGASALGRGARAGGQTLRQAPGAAAPDAIDTALARLSGLPGETTVRVGGETVQAAPDLLRQAGPSPLERADELRGMLDELDIEIESMSHTGIIRPPFATGISNQELLDVAKHEGLNPYRADWFDAMDPVVLKELRQGVFKRPVASLTDLRRERARLGRELNSTLEQAAQPSTVTPPDLPAAPGAPTAGGGLPPGPTPPLGAATPPAPPPQPSLIADPLDVDTQVRIAFQPNAARRLGQQLAKLPGIGRALSFANPSLLADSPVQKATIARMQMIDEGKNKIGTMMAHVWSVGTQEDLFGQTAQTGRLIEGRLSGRSVNELAENPTRFRSLLTPEQSEYLNRMNDIENSVFDLYKRNGININQVSGGETERFAGRIVMARLTPENELVEAGFVNAGGRPLTGRTGAERARTFATVAEAQAEGFTYLPYEDAVQLKAKSAWNRIVDKRIADWVERNPPEGVVIEPKQFGVEKTFGEFQHWGMPGRVFSGPGAKQFHDDFNQMLQQPQVNNIFRGINNLNAPNRVFALAMDGSIFMIQMLMTSMTHPNAVFKSGLEFGKTLFTAMARPDISRQMRAKLVQENSELLQRLPIITSSSGMEFTEALNRGGLLHSKKGLFRSIRDVAAPGISLQERGQAAVGVGQAVLGKYGALYRPFQQAYESASDAAGIYMAKALEPLAEGDPQRLVELKDYIDNMRGLASSSRAGVSPNQAMGEAALLLAPRYRRAVAALHVSALQGGLRGEMARNAYMHLAAGTTMAAGAITIGLGVQRGQSPQQIADEFTQVMNPTSHRFLLWRVGNQWVGPGGKINSDLRMLAKLANPSRWDDFTNLEEFNANPGVKWVRGQLAYFPGTAWNYIAGEDYLAEPITRDFSGEPLQAVKDLGKQVGESFIPLWTQSQAFEGGTAQERATRGVAEFWGMRAYPMGDRDRMDVLARETIGVPFDQLWPYKQRELTASLRGSRVRPSEYRQEIDRIDEELETKLAELDDRAAALPRYGTTGSVQSRLQNLDPRLASVPTRFRAGLAEMYGISYSTSGNAEKNDIVGLYYDATSEAANRRDQTYRVLFKEEQYASEAETPEQRALQEYYQGLENAKTPAGNFDSDRWNAILSRLENKWRREGTLEYTQANTHTRKVPSNLLRVLPESTQRRIRLSEQARQRYELRLRRDRMRTGNFTPKQRRY